MALSDADHARLQQALGLAHGAIGLSEPNPRVGCVLHDAAGAFAGSGHTQQAGGPHAEVMALRDAAAAGRSLQGGTAWVSLEPCAHHGRTPPCADALVQAGLARVVVAVTDPFDQVSGRGITRLRAAGVVVDLAEPGSASARQAHALNIGFFSRVLRQRPWVRLKVAASLDGRTALADGSSQWITGVAARADGHAWRQRASAVLTGIGTVLADDPRLDARLVPHTLPGWQPLRVVVDSGFNTPPGARLMDPPGQVLVVGAQAQPTRMAALRDAGAQLVCLPGPGGQVDLTALIQHLGATGVNELHVEAGATLNAALLQAGLVDELLVYLAPKLLGPGRPMVDLPALARLDDAIQWQFEAMHPVGQDVCLRARPPGALGFLVPAHAPDEARL